jgi:2-oxoisovalerate dehydrogenase E1 component
MSTAPDAKIPVAAPSSVADALDLPVSAVPALTDDDLRFAYRMGVRSRAAEEHIVRLVSRGEVKFAIFGPGEEVHGVATALALSKAVDPQRFGVVAHYRSGALCGAWCALNGVPDFTLKMLRQQFSKATDEMSGGRQMVYHLHLPEVGILPVQSPVGMQLGKAAGYAKGFRHKGFDDGVAMAIVGDGTTAEGDMHDAMNAASVWQLPVIYLVTDNDIAISTTPAEGRGIKSYETYARAFGIDYFACDGRDFFEVFETTFRCASFVREQQKPAVLYVHSLPRFNGHSSAADVTFDLTQDDPLVALGQELVRRGLLSPDDVLVRRTGTEGRDFFAHHDLGAVMSAEDEQVKAWLDQVRAEADPDPATVFEHTWAPFPTMPETAPGPGQTQISYAGAIRSALSKLIERKNGWMAGQDVAKLGGVMQASAGILGRHPHAIVDSPLNEPLIVGTATGFALHDDVMALPEIQFGDYSLNVFHWLVYLGNLRWSTRGRARAHLLLRMPVDPFGGGAMYHSMSVDGYFGSIPGLCIVMPSTSFDAHGLMLAAGEYDGPVVCLEPKWMYRQTLGPAFPGEPTDPEDVRAMKKAIMRGEIPDVPDVFVPLGKGVIRRAGADVTVVAWGRAVWTCLAAAETLAAQGISCEVIDLRTLVPPDMALVNESVGRTGRLIVASENRVFGGFVREIQGAVAETFPGVPTRSVGQKNVPGIAQSLILEDATVLTAGDVVAAASELVEVKVGGRGGWSFVPPRYFVS